MAHPRSFPVRIEDQPSIGTHGLQAPRAPVPATLDDVVAELRRLRRDLESRTLAARCARAWMWIRVKLSFFYWS